MTATVPLVLMLITLTALLAHRFRGLGRRGETILLQPELTSEQVESMLCDVRERKGAARQAILASGDVVELDEVYVHCRSGHRHKFRDFLGGESEGLPTWRFLEALNVTKQDGMGIYTGRQPGPAPRSGGVGWVTSTFGCKTCREPNFMFEQPRFNGYTTCGQHLVRQGLSECAMCREMESFAREELMLLAQREKHCRKNDLRQAV